MSALTSTPSPVASPRLSFYGHASPRQPFKPPLSRSHSRPSASSGQICHSPAAEPGTSPSARRAFWQNPKSSVPATSSNGLAATVSVPAAVDCCPRVTYRSTGTQYSPDGLPPTARRKAAASASKGAVAAGTLAADRSTASESASKKRKEREGLPHHQMSTADAASPSNTVTPAVPSEPRPRTDPSPSQVDGAPGHGSRQSLPQTSADNQGAMTDTPPREARSTSSAPKRPRPEPGAAKVMPANYSECNSRDLGVLIASMLMELIRLNDRIPLRDNSLTRFHSRAAPGISVSDYLQRLIQHATLSPPILLSMVFYIDRLCAMYPAFTITSLTVHRFLITAATVAAKGLSDSFWTNPTYARIGGIPVSELATLELEFLERVHWKIVPDPEALENYYFSLVERTDGYELEKKDTDDSATLSASSVGSGSSSGESISMSSAASAGQLGEKMDEG